MADDEIVEDAGLDRSRIVRLRKYEKVILNICRQQNK